MAGPKQMFMHIGLPKTGTTAWQTWADQHRADLLSQGIDYPAASTITQSPNHSALSQGLRRGDLAGLQDVLQSASAETLLLSSEGFSMGLSEFPERSLAAFREITRGITIVCLLITRPAEQWVVSMYRQAKLNNVAPKVGFGTADRIERFRATDRMKMLLDHARLAQMALAAFGATRCENIPYGKGAFDRFCAVVGIDAQNMAAPKRLNESVSAAVAELMRQLNGWTADETLRQGFLWLFSQTGPTSHNRLLAAMRPESTVLPGLAEGLAVLRPESADQHDLVHRLQVALAGASL